MFLRVTAIKLLNYFGFKIIHARTSNFDVIFVSEKVNSVLTRRRL